MDATDGDAAIGFAVSIDQTNAVLRLCGEFDLGDEPTFRDAFEELAEAAPARIAIDLGDLTYVGSTGLNELIRAYQTHPHVVLLSPRAEVRRVLQITGLDQFLQIEGGVFNA